jgi:hypothetical protein
MNQPTNGELKIMFDNLAKDSNEKHNAIMDILTEIKSDGKETKEQAIKTNGRVNRLEEKLLDYNELKKESSSNSYWIKAVVVGLGILGSIILALPNFFPNLDPLGVKEKARQAVQEELSKYNIQIKQQ